MRLIHDTKSTSGLELIEFCLIAEMPIEAFLQFFSSFYE